MLKSTGKNYLRLIVVLILACGLVYAFFNMFTMRMKGRMNMKQMQVVSRDLLTSVTNAQRIQCDTSVYLELDEEYLDLKEDNMTMIRDFIHDQMQVSKGNTCVIFEYIDDDLSIYSKGISLVYNKDRVTLQKVPTNEWCKYSTEEMFGENQRQGKNARLSYGFLRDKNYLVQIEKKGQEVLNDKKYTRFEVELRNTLRESDDEETENAFRKTLSAHGIEVHNLKKDYSVVYEKLKKKFHADTERMYVLLDEEGNLARIEKDYTFTYYLEVMSENSEMIENKVGQYGYPDAICIQEYSYDPICASIEIPIKYNEL